MPKEGAENKGGRLRALRDRKGLSRQRAVEFFKKHGYDFSTKSLQNWESGERKPRKVDLDDLTELLEGYQTKQDTQGAGEAMPVSGPRKTEASSGAVPDAATEYRFYGRNFGTEDEPVPETADSTVVVSDWIIQAELGRLPDPSVSYWTCVNGESMEPFLRDGAPILVEETGGQIEAPGRYVLYLNTAGGIVKRCQKLGESTLRVSSDNRSFSSPQVLTQQDGSMYEDRGGRSVRLCVQGRIIYPGDTARAVKKQVVHDVAHAVGSRQDKAGSTE